MAKTFSMKIKGLDELYAGFKKAKANFEPVMEQAMRNSTTKIQNDARENIRKNKSTYQGNLAKNTRRRDPVTAYHGEVVVGEEYGGAVEFGRRPGKPPPYKALERWAQLKLGQKGLGFVIARKIGKEGTKPKPFLEPAFRDNGDYVLGQFKEAADTLVMNMAGGGA